MLYKINTKNAMLLIIFISIKTVILSINSHMPYIRSCLS
ncbi:hypothetical protein [Emticicia agri]|uniref:Uncharacterized protein n=1 Tax=Emticicia agri TaxID=2492393 RepID=A0A4Q5LV48_9BACT|nr:hypothetical protein EWM59_22205 [Emticicia agri]